MKNMREEILREMTDEQIGALGELFHSYAWKHVIPKFIESYINALAHATLHDDTDTSELVKVRAEARVYEGFQNRLETEWKVASFERKQSRENATNPDSVE